MVPANTLLKTQQVAEAFGVSVSTVKRWVDSGSLRASRTPGKHRLISAEEALRFARAQELPEARLEVLMGVEAIVGGAIDDRAREALVLALKTGRDGEARTRLASAFAAWNDGARLADELISPVMAEIGHQWAAGSLEIYQEHRATRIVEAALLERIARVESAERPGGRPLAMGASPDGDPYTLSNLLCELALREQGWEVMNLGPNLPLASLGRAVRVHRPRLVWLSVNHLDDPEGFVRQYTAFYGSASATGTAVCLGGQALDSSLRARLPAAGFGERVAHLAEFARRLAPASPDDRPQTEPREDQE